MWLIIDPSTLNFLTLTLFGESSSFSKVYPDSNREFLFSIEAFLTEHNLSPEDIFGVAVVVGAGGFTATRVATITANLFKFVHQIPVVAISSAESQDLSTIKAKFLTDSDHYILPTYSAPPTIFGQTSPVI